MAHAITLTRDASRPGTLARMRQAIADWREYRAILGELEALTDRELADIGISRLNVREIAHASVYGD